MDVRTGKLVCLLVAFIVVLAGWTCPSAYAGGKSTFSERAIECLFADPGKPVYFSASEERYAKEREVARRENNFARLPIAVLDINHDGKNDFLTLECTAHGCNVPIFMHQANEGWKEPILSIYQAIHFRNLYVLGSRSHGFDDLRFHWSNSIEPFCGRSLLEDEIWRSDGTNYHRMLDRKVETIAQPKVLKSKVGKEERQHRMKDRIETDLVPAKSKAGKEERRPGGLVMASSPPGVEITSTKVWDEAAWKWRLVDER